MKFRLVAVCLLCTYWAGSTFGQESSGQNLPAGRSAATQPLSPQLSEGAAIHSGAMNLDINYPGAGLRYFLSDKTALEGRVQFDKKIFAGGGRLYWYPTLLSGGSPFSPYLCAEGDYLSFQGTYAKGNGFAGGAFAGIEYSLSRSFSLQMDIGSEYFSIKDQASSLTQSNMEFILNFGVNFYPPFGANIRAPQTAEGSRQKPYAGSRGHTIDPNEKCVTISQIGPGFDAWKGTEIDIFRDDPVCYTPTGLPNFDSFYDNVNVFVGKVRITVAVLQMRKMGRTTASNNMSLTVASTQLAPLLAKAVDDVTSIVKQGQALVTSAPGQFSGFKAFKLPGVIKSLQQSLENLSSAMAQAKDALAGLQAVSAP